MKLVELLKKHNDEEIIAELKKHYEDIDDESYKSALTELRGLTPSEELQTIKINVEFIKDKDNEESWLSCYGIGPDETGEEIIWGLEFNNWEDWLAEEIVENNFIKLDEVTILAGIMYEMTFDGFSQEDIQCRVNDLNNRIENANKHPEDFVELTQETLNKWIKEAD